MNEDKATRYQRLKRRTSVVSLVWGLLFLGALLATGGSVAVRLFAERLTGGPAAGWVPLILSRTIYLAVLAAINEALALPLSFYSGFLLEHRYGLSTQSFGHWLWQHGKGLLVGGVFGLIAFQFLY